MIRKFLDNYAKIKMMILILIVASLPFYLFASSIFIILGAITTILESVFTRKWSFDRLDFLSPSFVGFYFLEIVGLTYTEPANIGSGLFFLEKHIALLLIPLVFTDLKILEDQRIILLRTFIGTCLLASLICFFGNIYSSQKEYGVFFHPWIFSHDRFSDPIGMQAVYFSMYVGLCIFILLNLLMQSKRTGFLEQKALLLFLLLTFVGVIVQMGARTVIASVIAIVIVNLIYQAISKKSYAILFTAGIIPIAFILLILLNPVVKTRFADMFQKKYEESYYGSYFARSKIWIPGFELIKENYLFGVGTGDQQKELDKKYVKYDYPEAISVLNMHNQYLQMLLGFGVVGLLVFFAMLIPQYAKSFSTRDFLYLSFLVLFSLSCMTESMLNRNKGIVFFLIFSFIFYKGDKRRNLNHA